MNTSQYLNTNIAQILINWSKDFIRADYPDMSAYVQKKAVEYATELGINKDMTKQQVLERIRTAFLVPVKVLSIHKRQQQRISQTAGGIAEINEAIKYYQQY